MRREMDLFKNRRFAVLITVVVVVLATLFGVNKSLSRLSRDIEVQFYDGVYLESEGYTQPSIDFQLEKMSTAALNLATLLQGHPELTSAAEDLLLARRTLLDAESIRYKGRDLLWMDGIFATLVTLAGRVTDLSEREVDAVAEYAQAFESASIFVYGTLAPSYNSKVDGFYNERSTIAALVSNKAPEYFDTVPR